MLLENALALACLMLPVVVAAQPGRPPLFQAPLPTRASIGAIPRPDGVIELPAITYETADGYRRLKLDHYLPRQGGAAKPIYPGLSHGFAEASDAKLREIMTKTFAEIDALASGGFA